jgi:hypothetical protein
MLCSVQEQALVSVYLQSIALAAAVCMLVWRVTYRLLPQGHKHTSWGTAALKHTACYKHHLTHGNSLDILPT